MRDGQNKVNTANINNIAKLAPLVLGGAGVVKIILQI